MAAFKRAAKTSAAATFQDHLRELRSRLFAIVAVFIVASSIAYNYKDALLAVLMRPLGDEKLIYLTPAGGFSFIFQVTMYAGIIATVPVLVYNLYRFIAPVLSKKIRINSIVIVVSSMLLLICGVCFGYFYAIPAAMQFLVHFADGFANASLTAESYIGFVMAYTAGLGLLFQLPLLMLFIHWIYPLKPKKLFKFERYVLLLAFVAAAFISPTPDALNQTIIAIPIILMYQIGVIGVVVSVYRTKKKLRVVVHKTTRKERRTSKRLALAIKDAGVKEQPSVAVPKIPAVQVRERPKQVEAVIVSKPTSVTAVPTLRRTTRSMDGVRVPPVRLQQPIRMPVREPTKSGTLSHSLMRPSRSIDGVSILLKGLDDTIL